MNFSEIGLKDLVLDFDSNDLQDITIVQGDTKTRGFKVLVSTNNGEIIKASSQYEMRLYGINSNYPDKSFFTKGVIDGDFYKVYISTDMASKSGKLQLQLALFDGTNALIQSRIKEVDVYRSIANGGNVGKDLVVDFTRLQEALDRVDAQEKKYDKSLVRQEAIESDVKKKHTEVVQIRDELKDVLTTENARVEEEKKRVRAEQIRSNQEDVRKQLETTRQSSENARQSNESTRQSNERQRQAEESTRKSEEQKRIAAESNRNSEESKRDSAEKQRASNEDVRIKAENTRKENDATYSNNEQQRQEQEKTRQQQEQQRVEAEKLRQSQEDTRKQSEDTRTSQESTRQTQEQQRVDAEKKRASSESTREQTEQTRNTKESERQSNEQQRQSNESTRQQQETARVEAEKLRASAEAARAGKFEGWDKTMQGVIPTATSTIPGVVKIDQDGETVAMSKKTGMEAYNGLNDTLVNLRVGFDEELKLKANKKEVEESVSGLIGTYGNTVSEMRSGFDDVKSKISTNATEIDNTKKIANANSSSISTISTTLDNKASKTHTHKISELEGEIGGRNLIRNSDKPFTWFPNDGNNPSVTDEFIGEFNIQGQRIKAGAGNATKSGKTFVNFDIDEPVPGKTYTFSVYVKNNRDVSTWLKIFHFDWNAAYEIKARECKRLVISGKRDKVGDSWRKKVQLMLIAVSNDESVDATVARPQLEEGNVATSWNKNPDDLIDDVSNKNGGSLSFWSGTQSEYDRITSKDSNTIYFITE